jgi:hypothetical protein
LHKVLTSDNGIESRHLALDPLSEAFKFTTDAEWLFHSGGRDLLSEIVKRIGLSEHAVRHSKMASHKPPQQ